MSKACVRGVVCFLFLSLGACGGGGGSSSPQTTPPPPSFPLTAAGNFQSIDGKRAYTVQGNGSISAENGVRGRSATVTVNYNVDNGTYTVRDETTTATATFAAADRATPSGYLDVYSKQSGTVSDELKLFGNIRPGGPQTGAPLQLTYLSYGIWSHNDSQTGERRKAYLLFGYPTGSSMPVSGSATYQTAVTGNMLEAGVGYVATESEIGGSATFTANFGTGAISTDLALYRASNQSALGTFNGTGTITADQFSGTYTSNAQFFSGGFFHGGFFGPSATEMGYNFSINKNNPDPYAGATIAPMNTLIIGSVVGKKN